MSPEQRDYGHPESEDRALVPGTLTVFRHFQADLRSGVLMPMNYSPRQGSGFGPRPGQQPYTRPAQNLTGRWWVDDPDEPRPEPEQPVYQAQCDKLWRINHVTQYKQRPDHDAPDKQCTCGFYASYDPETDFYPSFRWGRLYSEIVGATGYEDIAIVKAAVEVSGTVVMGRLGVRAGRMKIVGLTLDWAKRIRPGDIDGGGPYGWRRDPYFGGSTQSRYVVYNHQTGEYEMRQVEVKDESEAKDIAEAHALASGYGATYYSSVAEMVEAHPMADVSALGVDTAPRPSEDYVGLQAQLYSQMFTAQQIAQVEQAMKDASKVFQQATASISASFDIDADLLFGKSKKPKRRKPKGGTMPEYLARALESKRKRQAPPGSGIDRRKKKL